MAAGFKRVDDRGASQIDAVRVGKARGANVTCEVAPHHFILTDQYLETPVAYDTNTKMNPPLRSEADRAALKKLLKLHGLELALKTMRQSFDRYLVWEDSGPTSTSLSLAYRKLLNLAAYSKLPSEVQAAHYCRGILRNRFPEEVSTGLPRWDEALGILSAALAYGYDERELKELCKTCDSYEEMDGDVAAFIAFEEYQKAKPPQAATNEAPRGFSARSHA